MRSITCIHPSKGRPEMAMETMNKWISRADKGFEYLLYVNTPDQPEYMKELDKWFIYIQHLVNLKFNLVSAPTNTAVEAINRGSKRASGDIFVIISDDFSCPEHWDTLLLDAIGDRADFCAKTIDGQQDWLITLPIMDRVYYERLGYIYHPSYSHMYADLDMTCTAHLLGKYISLPIEFHHNHPRYTDQVYDATYQRARATWGQGQKTFRERMQRNFDIVSDIKLPKEELIKQGVR